MLHQDLNTAEEHLKQVVQIALKYKSSLNSDKNWAAYRDADRLVSKVLLLKNKDNALQALAQMQINNDGRHDQAAIGHARDQVIELITTSYSRFLKKTTIALKLVDDKHKQAMHDFCHAYHYGNEDEQLCIDLISDNTDTQKLQLQFILGVLSNSPGRMVYFHHNTHLKVQKKLINRIKDTTFLSSLLRDFIMRPCDGGQEPCLNASDTIALLIQAGANPNADYLDDNYISPGYIYVSQWAGNPIVNEVKIWNNNEARKMVETLKASTLQTPGNSANILFRNITLFNLEGKRDYATARLNEMINELIDKHHISVISLPNLIKDVESQLLLLNKKLITDDDKNYFPYQLRKAEAMVLARIYEKEHQQEQQLFNKMMFSLFFAPLIFPLIYTIAVAIRRAILVRNSNFSVTREDLSMSSFERHLEIKHQINIKDSVDPLKELYKQRSPVKQIDEKTVLRKAIIFRQERVHTPRMYTLSRFFSGTAPRHTMNNEVSVYRVNKR